MEGKIHSFTLTPTLSRQGRGLIMEFFERLVSITFNPGIPFEGSLIG
jgi:hypothetical protein